MTNSARPALSYWAADRSEPVLNCSVGDALRSAAAAYGARTALIDGGVPYAQRRRWTFEQLLADAEHVAHALLQRFQPRDHIALWSPNARSAPAATRSWPAILTTLTPPTRRSTPTAGCTPAISARWMNAATAACKAVSRT